MSANPSTVFAIKAEIARYQGRYREEIVLRVIDSAIRKACRPFTHDLFLFGSWWGNDTIWRTVHDLQLVAQYCNVKGELCLRPQRQLFTIADMVVAGEGEGPLSPSPIDAGYILMEGSGSVLDVLIARLMGFNPYKIPSLAQLDSLATILEEKVRSNDPSLDGLHLSEVNPTNHFKAHSGWTGHIELDE